MCLVFAFKGLKNNGNLKKELIIYERFQLTDLREAVRYGRSTVFFFFFGIYGGSNHHLIKGMRN